MSGIKILQNAIQVRETGEIIRSGSRHDWCQSKCTNYYVDGGTDYQRIGYTDITGFIDLTVTEDTTLNERVQRAVWGTLGKDGKGPRKLVFLRDCDSEHLTNILDHNPHPWLREVIDLILVARGSNA